MDKNKRILDLDAFAVLGKEGSTKDGEGFIEKLWNTAERNYKEIETAVKHDRHGPIYWGAMSSFNHDLKPWTGDFKEGLYLAGFEMADPNLIPPEGWTKWNIPARKYFVLKTGDDYSSSFREGLAFIAAEGYALSGAVFDHMEQGSLYLYYPIEAAS